MKQKNTIWILALIVFCNLQLMSSCRDSEDNQSGGGTEHSTALFVATDRHEDGNGNNLTAMLAQAVAGSDIPLQTVLLGGDYVGGRGNMTPEFSINDLYDDVYAVVDPHTTKVMMTYGSHDDNCTEGYDAFYSGPYSHDGYYTYGISFVQMVYDTDAATTDPPSGGGMPKQRGYNGIDQADRYGISAESAARSFTQWVATIADNDPIVVMTHVPLHANRGDNVGAMTWFKALTSAAQTHDVLVLWGHNHTLEERGNSSEQYSYLLTTGDSIDVQGDSITGVVRCPLNFTYANAGYLKLGRASVITFTDTDGNGHYNKMELRRYSLNADDTDLHFGMTDKPNPFVITLSRTDTKY